MKVFLDMDGVLVDFVGGACRVHQRPNPYEGSDAALGEFHIEKIWGMTPSQFWEPIMDRVGFWQSLDETYEAKYLVEELVARFGLENIAILTSPNLDPSCIGQKYEWMRSHFPDLKDRMIFARANVKQFMASPTSLLVDDYDRNVEQWRAADGRAVLVPRPWNSDYQLSHIPMTTVCEQLTGRGLHRR